MIEEPPPGFQREGSWLKDLKAGHGMGDPNLFWLLGGRSTWTVR